MSVEVKAQNTISMTSVKAIKDATDEANDLLDSMRQSAIDAGTTLNGIYQDAEDAKTNAGIAQQSANQAIIQAGMIENVVGVVDWIARHGTYIASDDTVVVPSVLYFTLTGEAVATPTGNPEAQGYYELIDGVYVLTEDTTVDAQKTYYTVTATVVDNPTGSPQANGYYELLNVDEGVANYVSSHLALTNDGLILQNDNADGYRILISATDGVVLLSPSGRMASYGQNAVIGDLNGFHITIANNRLSFYRDDTNEVAYISGDKLYISQSVVLQQMDVGAPMVGGTGGQWSWKIHENANGQNNLYLKWIG